ncbi:MAG: ABC transporter permease [Planctomycetes bacterium]|nr:ABC transporter permease [Planctomycetota bacterium]
MYRLFLSLRYLRTRVVSYLAIGGMALGVMILVIVLSVMGGFQREFRERIRGIDSHLTVESLRFYGLRDAEALCREIEEVPDVVATAPYIENITLVRGVGPGSTKDFGFLRGIDPAREAAVGSFGEFLLSPRERERELLSRQRPPTLDDEEDLARFPAAVDPARAFEGGHTGFPPVLVGIEMFWEFGLEVGGLVRCLTSSDVERMKDSQEETFEVVGVFKTGIWDNDRRYLYAPLDVARRFIVGDTSRSSGVSVRIRDHGRVDEMKGRLNEALGLGLEGRYHLRCYTWKDRKKSLLQAVEMEKWLLSFILIFMVALMALNVLSILIMSVVEKTRDLGILRALGGTSGGVLSIFTAQGHFIGFFGATIGLGMGLAFTRYINEIADGIEALTGYHPFPKKIYYLDRIPTDLDLGEVAICVGVVILIGFLFSVPAAYKAARMDPVDALRYE